MKVLVARCDRLGDLVLSLPAVAWLRAVRPDWQIHALVSPAAVPLVERDPNIDAYYTWDLTLTEERRPQLAAERYDAAVLLQYQTPLARLLGGAGIRRRYGPLSKISSLWWLNRGSLQRRSRGQQHESNYNVELVQRLAGDVATDLAPGLPVVHLGDEQVEYGRGFRAREADGAQTVAFVHPGSGGSALDWPPEHFAAVANALSRRPGWRVFVTGSHHDRLAIDALGPHLEPEVQVVAERFPLREFMGVLSAGDLMVAPSTGPLHLAAGVGLACVGLFPPAPTMHPHRWGVLGPWSESVLPPVDCPAKRYCLAEGCLLYNCLDGLLPSQIIDTAVSLVDRRRQNREIGATAGAKDPQS